jgi:hypothetical protein
MTAAASTCVISPRDVTDATIISIGITTRTNRNEHPHIPSCADHAAASISLSARACVPGESTP